MSTRNLETQQPPPEVEDPHLCPSLWAQYKWEMHQIEVIEKPYGFISYKLDGEMVHIIDVFILPGHRTGKGRRELFAAVVERARPLGAIKAVGQVQVTVNGSTRRLSFWLMMGAEVFKAVDNVIYLVKRI